MSTESNFKVFLRSEFEKDKNCNSVLEVGRQVRVILNKPEVISKIATAHVFGATSHSVQATILDELSEIGFTSEKKGLFADFKVPGIRPDYFKPHEGGGFLFEVERGKTIANNMDLLDVWKTHICREARHLILLVPNIRVTGKGAKQNIFSPVQNRISAFFHESVPAIDVDSIHLIGY